VSYSEFLVGIRGTLGPRRKALVQLAFDVLDKDGSGNFLQNHDIIREQKLI
jgi:hypothetical protein